MHVGDVVRGEAVRGDDLAGPPDGHIRARPVAPEHGAEAGDADGLAEAERQRGEGGVGVPCREREVGEGFLW